MTIVKATGKTKNIDNQRVLFYRIVSIALTMTFACGLVFAYLRLITALYISFAILGGIAVAGVILVFWLIKNRPNNFPGPSDFSGEEATFNSSQIKQIGKINKNGKTDKKKPKTIFEDLYIGQFINQESLSHKKSDDNNRNNDDKIMNQIVFKAFNVQRNCFESFNDLLIADLNRNTGNIYNASDELNNDSIRTFLCLN